MKQFSGLDLPCVGGCLNLVFALLFQLHKSIEARDEQLTKLQSENEELQELAQHVQYMADMIEVSIKI